MSPLPSFVSCNLIIFGREFLIYALCRGVPPGARFDPYGPPGVPGFEPGRFVR